MSALETVVLQVCAGPLMGEAFVPGASFIFLFSQGAARPGAGRVEPASSQSSHAATRGRARAACPRGAHALPKPVPVPERGTPIPPGLGQIDDILFFFPPLPRCRSTHVGERCQLPNPCQSSPCKNAGTCTPVVRGGTADYTCACRLGFTDELCLTPRENACLNNPCRNGGTCELLTLSEYKCRCPPGWSGEAAAGSGGGCNPRWGLLLESSPGAG